MISSYVKILNYKIIQAIGLSSANSYIMGDKCGKVAVYLWSVSLPCNCHFPLTIMYPNKFSATGDAIHRSSAVLPGCEKLVLRNCGWKETVLPHIR